MRIYIASTKEKLGRLAAEEAAEIIKRVISEKGFASIILATGASQFEILKALVASNEVDWSKVIMFHLDEYINLPATHPASFRKYLINRILLWNLMKPAGGNNWVKGGFLLLRMFRTELLVCQYSKS